MVLNSESLLIAICSNSKTPGSAQINMHGQNFYSDKQDKEQLYEHYKTNVLVSHECPLPIKGFTVHSYFVNFKSFNTKKCFSTAYTVIMIELRAYPSLSYSLMIKYYSQSPLTAIYSIANNLAY